MQCQEFKKVIDSYLSDELLVETNHDVLRHLENCASCRSDLAERRDLKNHLRSAVIGMPEMQIAGSFAARLRMNLRDDALRPGIWQGFTGGFRVATIAFACLAIVIAGAFFFVDRRPVETVKTPPDVPITQDKVVSSNNTEIAQAVRASWTELAERAVADHKNCAVRYNLAEDPISLDEAAKKYGSFNKDIDKSVVAALDKVFPEKGPDAIKFLEAHSCIHNGRQFTHIVLRQHGSLISVIITDTDLPADISGFEEFHSPQKYHAAGFRVGRHAVFVVSELPEAQSTMMAKAIQPAIAGKIESAGV